MRVAASLVPEPARTVPGKRALGVAFRAAHIASFGVLLGGTLFAVEPARLAPWLLATAVSGATLVTLELASTCAWLTTVKGLAVVAKLALLAAIGVIPEHRLAILFAVVAVASVTSHMPARFRHHQLVAAWRVPPLPDGDDEETAGARQVLSASAGLTVAARRPQPAPPARRAGAPTRRDGSGRLTCSASRTAR